MAFTERISTPGEDSSWRTKAIDAAEWLLNGPELSGGDGLEGLIYTSDEDSGSDDDRDDDGNKLAVVERLPAARMCRMPLTLLDESVRSRTPSMSDCGRRQLEPTLRASGSSPSLTPRARHRVSFVGVRDDDDVPTPSPSALKAHSYGHVGGNGRQTAYGTSSPKSAPFAHAGGTGSGVVGAVVPRGQQAPSEDGTGCSAPLPRLGRANRRSSGLQFCSGYNDEPPTSDQDVTRSTSGLALSHGGGGGSLGRNLLYSGQQHAYGDSNEHTATAAPRGCPGSRSEETTGYSVPRLGRWGSEAAARVSDYGELFARLQQPSSSRPGTPTDMPSSPVRSNLVTYVRSTRSCSGAAAAVLASRASACSQMIEPGSSGRLSGFTSPMASRSASRHGRLVEPSSVPDAATRTGCHLSGPLDFESPTKRTYFQSFTDSPTTSCDHAAGGAASSACPEERPQSGLTARGSSSATERPQSGLSARGSVSLTDRAQQPGLTARGSITERPQSGLSARGSVSLNERPQSGLSARMSRMLSSRPLPEHQQQQRSHSLSSGGQVPSYATPASPSVQKDTGGGAGSGMGTPLARRSQAGEKQQPDTVSHLFSLLARPTSSRLAPHPPTDSPRSTSNVSFVRASLNEDAYK